MRSRSFAEHEAGETIAYFSQIALTYRTDVIFGMIELSAEKYFNSLLHINSSGEIQSKYRKIHPFSFTGEDRFYDAGSEPVITDIKGTSFGLTGCYDLRFPELYRFYGRQGVSGIINIANWPVQRIDHWTSLLKARAIENQCFVIAVNRTGKDKTNNYNGRSKIIDPSGTQLVEMKSNAQFEITAIDLRAVAETRKMYPFLQDIRLL